ncbi:hydramacin-1-like [Biomphalaria glabrata]|uniref:Hydramacin-1-like n=1 Tax=Biomphalaria glabrata TaxID=6526 RepID=A0A9W2YJC1_BIOGL|nr:hydramacin-1-like [Biomphalaria glabrata]
MAAALKIFSALVVVGIFLSAVEAGWGDCYETWSRCSRWSSPFTGVLWKSCNDRCKELKKRGGNCVQTPSKCPVTSKAYQCQCY